MMAPKKSSYGKKAYTDHVSTRQKKKKIESKPMLANRAKTSVPLSMASLKSLKEGMSMEARRRLVSVSENKQRRQGFRLIQRLEDVMAKISQTLVDFGLDPTLPEPSISTGRGAQLAQLTMIGAQYDCYGDEFDAKERAQQLRDQTNVMTILQGYHMNIDKRETLLKELAHWFSRAETTVEQIVNVTEKEHLKYAEEKVEISLTPQLNIAEELSNKVAALGERLLKHIEIQAKRRAAAAKRGRRLQYQFKDESTMIADYEMFEQACNEVAFVMDRSLRQLRTQVAKQDLRSAMHQFKAVVSVANRDHEKLIKDEGSMVGKAKELQRLHKELNVMEVRQQSEDEQTASMRQQSSHLHERLMQVELERDELALKCKQQRTLLEDIMPTISESSIYQRPYHDRLTALPQFVGPVRSEGEQISYDSLAASPQHAGDHLTPHGSSPQRMHGSPHLQIHAPSSDDSSQQVMRHGEHEDHDERDVEGKMAAGRKKHYQSEESLLLSSQQGYGKTAGEEFAGKLEMHERLKALRRKDKRYAALTDSEFELRVGGSGSDGMELAEYLTLDHDHAVHKAALTGASMAHHDEKEVHAERKEGSERKSAEGRRPRKQRSKGMHLDDVTPSGSKRQLHPESSTDVSKTRRHHRKHVADSQISVKDDEDYPSDGTKRHRRKHEERSRKADDRKYDKRRQEDLAEFFKREGVPYPEGDREVYSPDGTKQYRQKYSPDGRRMHDRTAYDDYKKDTIRERRPMHSESSIRDVVSARDPRARRDHRRLDDDSPMWHRDEADYSPESMRRDRQTHEAEYRTRRGKYEKDSRRRDEDVPYHEDTARERPARRRQADAFNVPSIAYTVVDDEGTERTSERTSERSSYQRTSSGSSDQRLGSSRKPYTEQGMMRQRGDETSRARQFTRGTAAAPKVAGKPAERGERSVSSISSEEMGKSEKLRLLMELDELRNQVAMKTQTISLQDEKIEMLKGNVNVAIRTIEQSAKEKKHLQMEVAQMDQLQQGMDRLQRHYDDQAVRIQNYGVVQKQGHQHTVHEMKREKRTQFVHTLRQCTNMLRALNQFKVGIAMILQRENLYDEAAIIMEIPNLTTENVPIDPADLLMAMSKSAIQFLATLELKLNNSINAWQNRSIVVDEKANIRMSTAVQKVQSMSQFLMEQIKSVKEEFTQTTDSDHRLSISTMTVTTEVEQQNYDHLKNRMEQMLKDFTLAMTTLNEPPDVLHVSSVKYAFKEEMAEDEDMNLPRSKAYRHNLKILKKAAKENKISTGLYELAMEVVKQAEHLTARKAPMFFAYYVQMRRLVDLRAELQDELLALLESETASFREKEQLAEMIQNISLRIQQLRSSCKTERAELIKMEEYFQRHATKLLGQVAENTSLPLVKASFDGTTVVTTTALRKPDKLTTCRTVDRHLIAPQVPAMYSELRGHSMRQTLPQPKMWKVSEPVKPALQTVVEMPRLLAMDITWRGHRQVAMPLHNVKLVDIERLRRTLKKKIRLPPLARRASLVSYSSGYPSLSTDASLFNDTYTSTASSEQQLSVMSYFSNNTLH